MILDIELEKYIEPKYEWTDKLDTVKEWLSNINSITAFDFETASKYSREERKEAKNNLNILLDYKKAFISGLSTPEETVITHLGFSNNEQLGYVIVFNDDKVRDTVLDFLTTTDTVQIWHNPVFDFRHIYYYTNRFPKHYIDTRLLVKTYKNNVNDFLGSASLKTNMKKYYGEWEKEKVPFEYENKYDERLIKYTATDVCATYKLYNILK